MKTIRTLCILIAAATLATASVHAECYSDGVRVGVVQKLSSKGMVNKSWEGELVMEGEKIKGNSSGIKGGNVWNFSVLDPAVAKVIDESTMSGAPVALRYCQASPLDVTVKMSTDTPYRITQAVIRAK
jgi:hypothetical protein